METEKELEDLLFNIASKNVPKSDQEPDIKEFIRKTNEIYETKIYEAADFKKLKPIAEKGNFHMNVIEMDSTYQYTCYELQRLVEKINSSGNLPLKVYYEKIPATSVSYFEDAFKKSNLPSDQYGLALSLSKNNEFKDSILVMNELISKFPKNLILNTSRVEIYLNAGLYKEANSYVDKFLSISPGNYPLTITKAKILNATGAYFAAEELLRGQLLKRNGDPYLWLLLSDIQRDGKNIVGYYQSKAEYHVLLGQYEEAISQLEFALQLTKNNFQVSESVMTKIIDIKNKINKSRGL